MSTLNFWTPRNPSVLKETCLPERGFFSKINDSLPGSTGFHPVLRVDFCHSFRNKGITVPKIPPILRRINGTKKTPSIENNSMNFPPPFFVGALALCCWGSKKKHETSPKTTLSALAKERKNLVSVSFWFIGLPIFIIDSSTPKPEKTAGGLASLRTGFGDGRIARMLLGDFQTQ